MGLWLGMESMTGYGRASGGLAGRELVIEMTSVNRRHLEIQCRLPAEWTFGERELQEWLKGSLARGAVVCSLKVDIPGSGEGGLPVDEKILAPVVERFRGLSRRLEIPFAPDAHWLLALTQSLEKESGLCSWEECRDKVRPIFDEALAGLRETRKREGKALQKDLQGRVARVKEWLFRMREEAGNTVPRYREILLQRLARIDLEWDPQDERVLREVAIFADRCDTTEELVRLQSHWETMEEYLRLDEPVGRRADFLLQEINREYHTVGSKANNVNLSRLVLESRNECERIREQIQNIQ